MSAFDEAFDRGFRDAQEGKPRKSNPSFWKGLIRPSYIDDNGKGYKAGYDAGLREKRYIEIEKKITNVSLLKQSIVVLNINDICSLASDFSSSIPITLCYCN